jgi:hypothetical protein
MQADPKELHLMGAEKVLAFGESWNAMFIQAGLESQKIALSAVQSLWFPWLAPRSSMAKQLQSAAFGIAGAGMAPIHRRAVANAKRLRRAKRRR